MNIMTRIRWVNKLKLFKEIDIFSARTAPDCQNEISNIYTGYDFSENVFLCYIITY